MTECLYHAVTMNAEGKYGCINRGMPFEKDNNP